MARKAVLSVGLLMLLAVIGSGQADPREQLTGLLPNQEELQELLGDQWVITTVDKLDPEPEGAVSAVATFVDTSTEIELVDALIQFQMAQRSQEFLEAVLQAKQVLEVRDLLAEAREDAELLTERLQKETDAVLLVRLEGDLQQFFLRRATLLAFLRTPREVRGAMELAQLIQVADLQLGKVLDFCESFEGEALPSYCARETSP